MTDDLADLYRELLMDHSRDPRNQGVPDRIDRRAEGDNPLCGDRVTVLLELEDGRIVDARFDATACAICTASASMMTERVRGLTIAEAARVFSAFRALLTGEPVPEADAALPAPDLGDAAALAGVRRFPMRVKCATLPWHVLGDALGPQAGAGAGA